MKAVLFVIALAACGGKSQPATTPAEPPPTDVAAEAPPADQPPAGATTTSDDPAAAALAQAALTEQYELGKKVYVEKKCASCHEDNGAGNAKNPPVIGPNALPEQAPPTSKLRKGITFKTAKDVLDFVKTKMPLKNAGTLTDEEAAAVTSWMLSETKVNITAKLDASNAASINLR